VNQYKQHWEESFERLDAYLRDLQDEQQQGADDERDTDRPR
jgi:hypothetical protein